LPVYGDWRYGEIIMAYTPLMHLALAPLGLLGADPVSVLRRVNLCLICLCGLGVVRLAFVALRTRDPLRWSLAALSGLLFFTAWTPLGFAMQFRPDPLLLALALATIWVLWRTPERIKTIAALSVLCFLAKQPGLAVGAACALYLRRMGSEAAARVSGVDHRVRPPGGDSARAVEAISWPRSGGVRADT